MKKLLGLISFSLGASQLMASTIMSDWTFETSQPVGTAAGSFGAFAPEIGSGIASGSHAASAAYSSPAGNGSSHSFSVNTWAVNDYYQFQVSPVNLGVTSFSNVNIAYDQTSSATGPGSFLVSYSTDGINFTTISSYSPLANSAPNAWSAGTAVPAAHFTDDLSLIGALNNAATLYFRVVDTSTTAENGTTVATTGTDRLDNFTIAADVVPEPSTLALIGFGGAGLLAFARRKK